MAGVPYCNEQNFGIGSAILRSFQYSVQLHVFSSNFIFIFATILAQPRTCISTCRQGTKWLFCWNLSVNPFLYSYYWYARSTYLCTGCRRVLQPPTIQHAHPQPSWDSSSSRAIACCSRVAGLMTPPRYRASTLLDSSHIGQ